MAIRFPPERRQPPPHYAATRRQVEPRLERSTVRAIVHPDAVRIWTTHVNASRPPTKPVPPHAIVFATTRPPPGEPLASRPTHVVVRAVVHPDATRPMPRRIFERTTSKPTAPHRIAFGVAIAPPRR